MRHCVRICRQRNGHVQLRWRNDGDTHQSFLRSTRGATTHVPHVNTRLLFSPESSIALLLPHCGGLGVTGCNTPNRVVSQHSVRSWVVSAMHSSVSYTSKERNAWRRC